MMDNNKLFLSVIIPCRNEEKFIGECLDSVLAQDYSREKMEILVVDGLSQDKTREIVGQYKKKNNFIRLLDNPKKVTPVAMNIGLRAAKGEAMTMISAHCILDEKFLSSGAEYLDKFCAADAVGGALKTINDEKNIIAQAIPLAADSSFGTGGNRYRTRVEAGFINDTLPYAIYRRELFARIGYIDEELIRDQDEEFNYRILNHGGRIYFTPKIKSFLHIRPSLLKLWRQHFQYGYWKIKVITKVGIGSVKKQLVPGLFVAGLLGSLTLSLFWKPFLWLFAAIAGVYLAVNLFFSAKIAARYGLKFFFALLVSFFILHFSYGLGFLNGVLDFSFLKKKGIRDVPLTR